MIRVIKDLHNKQKLIEEKPSENAVPSLPSIAGAKLAAVKMAASQLLNGSGGKGRATSAVTRSGSDAGGSQTQTGSDAGVTASVTGENQTTQTSGSGTSGEVSVQADMITSAGGSTTEDGVDEEEKGTGKVLRFQRTEPSALPLSEDLLIVVASF